MKKNNKKGFTLAELLVVVGIIAILVAIAIPTFSAATKKATIGVEKANARSAYAEYKVEAITEDKETTLGTKTFTYDDGKTYSVTYDTTDKLYTITITGGDVESSKVNGKAYHYAYGANNAG